MDTQKQVYWCEAKQEVSWTPCTDGDAKTIGWVTLTAPFGDEDEPTV